MVSDDESNRNPQISTSSIRKKRLSSTTNDHTSMPVLSAEYLGRYSNKNDLVKRLRIIVEALSDENVEADSPEYPGLARLASDIVEDRYLKHKDKEVRLYTVLACMEIFCVYVPEPPYDENEILKIFTQLIQQLANLSNCTSPKQTNFPQYLRLLQRLANFKIGVVLVEMTKTLDLESEFSSQMSDHHHRNRDSPSSEEAMEVLRELIEVLLNSIQIDHPNEVKALAISAICGCIEEFYGTVPIPILDELLKCVGAGPVIYVTNPAFVKASAALAAAKKRGHNVEKEKLPPVQIQQTNPSYMVACSVIKKTLDKLSTPTASLLNGLLNGDTNVMKYSNIACSDEPVAAEKGTIIAATGCIPEREQQTVDVWSIVYELHKVSPQILTTVIGTVASSLQSPDDDRRFRVTKLLGKLFYSKTSNIGVNFHLCYKDWIKRSMDVNIKIREVMVKCLLEILRNKGSDEMLCKDASDALVKIVTSDPSHDIRILCIHKICDLAYTLDNNAYDIGKQNIDGNKPVVSAQLLHAIGNRVSSKIKKERLDSLTGLAKIYNRHFISHKLKQVQEGGDDCNIDIILGVIHCNCDLSRYKLSRKLKRGKSTSPSKRYPISKDSHEIDEKYKFIALKVFDSAFFTDKADPAMRNRVVSIMDDVLLGGAKAEISSNEKVLTATSRAIGLAIIMNHLLTSEGSAPGSGENGASFKWMRSLLLQRAQLQQALNEYIETKSKAETFPNGSEERNNYNYEAYEKLKVVATLTSPPSTSGSIGTSSENLSTILSKIHNARDKHIFRLLASIAAPAHSLAARSRAIEELPKRTKSLGSAASSWIKSLARRCSMGNFVNTETITHCILLAQEALRERDFQATMAFLECVKVGVTIFPSIGGTEEGYEALLELFGACRTSLKNKEVEDAKEVGILSTLIGIIAAVTPFRKAAVKNDKDGMEFEDDLKDELYNLCTKDGTPEQVKHAVYILAALASKDISSDLDEQQKTFSPLLKSLTTPSHLRILDNSDKNEKLINILATLTALVESAPMLFMSSQKNDHGNKAVRFALDHLLLNKEKVGADSSLNIDDGEMSDVSSKRKLKKGKGDKNLSIFCRMTMAAIQFLVCYIRCTILQSRKHLGLTRKGQLCLPSSEQISAVFELLVNLIKDDGLFSSGDNLNEFSGSNERASLRKCAAISLLRLCDGSINLESKFLSSKSWHILSKIFVDEDLEVRDTLMNELSMMLVGEGYYRQGKLGCLPSLRFLACISLCPDDDHHSSLSRAAKVGRRATTTKEAALNCVISLRRTSEETSLQCRAMSKKAEENFEKNFKMKLMPEYSLYHAFHLLSFRPETPVGEFVRRRSTDQDDEELNREEAAHKLLRKRLRWLLEPLVQSLGDGADNISFLLRLTELLGQRYRPVDVFESKPSMDSPISPFSDISLGDKENTESLEVSQAKLKVICSEAREILLKFVKKDTNLNPYPGAIQIPSLLYTRSKKSRHSDNLPKPDEDRKDLSTPSNSNKKRRIKGKPAVRQRKDDEINIGLSLNLSPIAQSRTPDELKMVSTEESMQTPDSVIFSPEQQEQVSTNTKMRSRGSEGSRSFSSKSTATRSLRRSTRLSKD